jgi:antitoxin component of MazEF toxin-antitoxin module
MKIVRRLAMRGNGIYVCIPRQMMSFLTWNIGDALVVEVIEGDQLRVRLAEERDMRTASIPPMNLALPHGAAK